MPDAWRWGCFGEEEGKNVRQRANSGVDRTFGERCYTNTRVVFHSYFTLRRLLLSLRLGPGQGLFFFSAPPLPRETMGCKGILISILILSYSLSHFFFF
jgi:hypothetical protein